jgi:hypothetical protein
MYMECIQNAEVASSGCAASVSDIVIPCSSETLVTTYKTTCCHYHNLNNHCCENLKTFTRIRPTLTLHITKKKWGKSKFEEGVDKE